MLFSPFFSMDFNDQYARVLNGIEEAKNHSLNGGSCAHYSW